MHKHIHMYVENNSKNKCIKGFTSIWAIKNVDIFEVITDIWNNYWQEKNWNIFLTDTSMNIKCWGRDNEHF